MTKQRDQGRCPSLDLHGDTADQARRRTEHWLTHRRLAGERVVRVVTGRGARSAAGPVLFGAIGDLLSSLRGSVVADYFPEARQGAYRVELLEMTRAERGRLEGTTPTRIDPELRMRAEESLHDLGITPTPELIEAEARRLSRQ